MKIIEWIKDHPKTSVAVGLGGLAIGLLVLDGGDDSGAASPIVVQSGVDGQTAVGLAGTAAADAANQRQVAASQQVAEKQTDAAVVVATGQTAAQIEIAKVNAEVYKQAIDASTVGQLGIYGVIHTAPACGREQELRIRGYSGAFGAGGAERWYIANWGKDSWQQFLQQYPC